MYNLVVLLVIFLWIMTALWPAFIAKNKGYSFILFFLISIPFWWITLFVSLLIKAKPAGTEPAEK